MPCILCLNNIPQHILRFWIIITIYPFNLVITRPRIQLILNAISAIIKVERCDFYCIINCYSLCIIACTMTLWLCWNLSIQSNVKLCIYIFL